MSYTKIVLLRICLLFLALPLIAQQPAVAFPVNEIKIDGDLTDWPEYLPRYNIKNTYGPKNKTGEDFMAIFMAGYNVEEESIYVAVRVIDNDHIGDNGNSHMTQDHALLYLDRLHNFKGGPPFFYVAAENHLELQKKSNDWDEHHGDITLENVKVKVKHSGNSTNYEWKIRLGQKVKPNTVLGIDHFIIDQDQDQDQQLNTLWKDGFAKSGGSELIGDLILLNRTRQLGSLEGSLQLPEGIFVDEISVHSVTAPNFWVKMDVDSTGNFYTVLPEDTYKIVPNRKFNSPLLSSGFKQNTRKLKYHSKDTIVVKGNTKTTIEPIKVDTLALPTGMSGAGFLYADKIRDAHEIDRFIKEWKAYYEIPGVSVAIIHKNKVIYDQNLGFKNNITKEPITETTLFEAASISKSVFAVMTLRLAERNLIDLDKPLYEYLSFPNLEGDERSKILTARIILNHQSGLPNWAWGGPGAWKTGGSINLNFEPGTEFGYSGEAFNYLGRVLEHITGKKLPEIFEEEIAKTFRLKNAHYSYANFQQKETAIGHYQQYPFYKGKEYDPSPASSVTTNAHDFKKFVLGLLNEKHLRKETFQLIYTPETILKPEQKIYDPEIPQYVSHGFFVQETSYGKLLAHGGNNGDYDCKFAYNPSEKIGFVAFTNSNLGDEFVRKLEEFLFNSNGN